MIVRVEDLEVTYPGAVPVQAVRGVSFGVASGEFVAIVGPSGSGKTSVLQVLGALLPPTRGSVEVLGVDLAATSGRERDSLRAWGIGFVFQEFHLLSRRSVIDNVALGGLYQGKTRRERYQSATEAISILGIGHRAGSRAATLSGGERQRVAIARALNKHPRLLLCDEPTGNLDSTNSQAIVAALRDLSSSRGLTVIVVTHDPEVTAATDRSIVMRDGMVVA